MRFYGDLPLDQPDLFFTEDPIHTSAPYSASKAGADLLEYHRTYSLPVTISRCSNNYGPYRFPEKLIPLMIVNALNNKPLPVYGEGLNVRNWLYVEDHCKAIDLIILKGHDMRYAIDPAKVHNELGWLPETAFQNGIQKPFPDIWTISNGGNPLFSASTRTTTTKCMRIGNAEHGRE